MTQINCEKLCRICVKESYFFSNVFHEQLDDGSLFVDVVNDLLQVDIGFEDGYPQYLCSKCFNKILEFVLFKRTAHESRAVLLYSKGSIENNGIKLEDETADDGGFVPVQTEVYLVPVKTEDYYSVPVARDPLELEMKIEAEDPFLLDENASDYGLERDLKVSNSPDHLAETGDVLESKGVVKRHEQHGLQETSEVNAESESVGKGKRKRKARRYSSSSFDSEDDGEASHLDSRRRIGLPKLPTTPRGQGQLEFIPSFRRDSPSEFPTSHLLSENDLTSVESYKISRNSMNVETLDSDFKKYVMRQLAMHRTMMKHNKDLLETIVQRLPDDKMVPQNGLSSAGDDLEDCLPTATEEGLRILEQSLRDHSYAEKMVTHLSQIRGTSVPDATRQILKRVMTDSLAIEYSLAGVGQKKSFMGLGLATVVIRAVQESQNAPEKEIKAAIRNWLRHSRERLNGRKKGQNNGMDMH